MKRIIALFLAALLCFSLAGCGGSTQESAEPEATADPAAAENAQKEADYAAAQALLDSRDYDGAEEAFKALGDYEDAEKILKDLRTKKRLYQDATWDVNHEEDFTVLSEAYGMFAQLGDYKDAADYLAQFTVVEDVLLSVDAQVDSSNEEITGLTKIAYNYTPSGQRKEIVFSGNMNAGDPLSMLYPFNAWEIGLLVDGEEKQEYNYTEDGLLDNIILYNDVGGYAGEELVPWEIIQYEYTDEGVMSGGTWSYAPESPFSNDGTVYHFEFTYTDAGQMATALFFKSEGGYGFIFDYDEDGKLIRETDRSDTFFGRTEYIADFTYDDNGLLQEITYTDTSDGMVLYTYNYTWQDGRVVESEYSGVRDEGYWDILCTYNYGNFNIYNGEAA